MTWCGRSLGGELPLQRGLQDRHAFVEKVARVMRVLRGNDEFVPALEQARSNGREAGGVTMD